MIEQPACTVCGDAGFLALPDGEIACPLCCSAPPMRSDLVTIPCEFCAVGIELCECEL